VTATAHTDLTGLETLNVRTEEGVAFAEIALLP
jgi:hypothetical protein